MKDQRLSVSFYFLIFLYQLNLTTSFILLFISVSDENLKRNNYVVSHDILTKKISEYVSIYNYTLDQDSLIRAIKFMYSPWSDPNNLTLIRQGYIDVSIYQSGNRDS